jgi:hypothetical protein
MSKSIAARAGGREQSREQMKEQSDYVNELRDDLNRMNRRVRELEEQLAKAINGKLPEDQHLDPDMISVQSMVASQTGEGMVLIRWFTHVSQLPISAARELAFNLLDAGEAAKSDAFMINFLKEKIGLKMEDLGGVIMDFRDYREKQNNKETE